MEVTGRIFGGRVSSAEWGRIPDTVPAILGLLCEAGSKAIKSLPSRTYLSSSSWAVLSFSVLEVQV